MAIKNSKEYANYIFSILDYFKKEEKTFKLTLDSIINITNQYYNKTINKQIKKQIYNNLQSVKNEDNDYLDFIMSLKKLYKK